MNGLMKIGAVTAAVLCLCGCQNTKTYEEQTEPENSRQVLVLWSYYETKEQQVALDELTEGFNKSQDKYQLTWQYRGPVAEFNKKLAIGITQDQLPDIVIIDNPDMRRYVEQGIFEDITEQIIEFEHLDQYYSNVLSSVIYDGRYYGLPFCCNNTGLIYNKEMLAEKELDVPETWDELLVAAELLTDDQKNGFALSAINGEEAAFQILPFILSAGDTVDHLGGEGSRAAFQLIRELAEKGALPKACINWSQNDVAQKFINREVAMMENGPWVLPALDSSGISYGIAKLPYFGKTVGVAGGENMGILKGKNKEGAIDFMKYYNRSDTMLNTALRANSLPPRKDLTQRMLSVKPKYQIFAQQMPECISRSAYKMWPQVTGLLSDAQFQIITGTASPDQICEMLQDIGK